MGTDRTKPRTLLVPIALMTVFQAFDSSIPATSLKEIARAYRLSPEDGPKLSAAIAAVALGGVFSFFVGRWADVKGRRVLWVVALVFTLLTSSTALAPSLGLFVAAQALTRVFLVAGFAIALTVAIENARPNRRGTTAGWITLAGALGLPLAGALGAMPFRMLLLLSLAALPIVMSLKSRLDHVSSDPPQEANAKGVRYGSTLLEAGGFSLLVHFALFAAIAWFPYRLTGELGVDASSARVIGAAAYGAGLIGILAGGRAQDRLGRRRAGTIFAVFGTVLGFAACIAPSRQMASPLIVLAAFFAFGLLPVAGVLSAELFPRSVRARAATVVRGTFNMFGAMLGPAFVGALGDRNLLESTPGIGIAGSLGNAMAIASLALLPAIAILRGLPETAGRKLENIELAAEAAAFRSGSARQPT